MLNRLHRIVLVALLVMGSAILLFSCKSTNSVKEETLDNIKTEESEDLTIVMSENGRKSYLFKAPLLEGYTLGRDPYREFRKGISITTYQDDSLGNVNAVLVANYAIYYENRKLWEAKGDVVVTKHDGTRLYTQQLFWNSMTKRIYSNVDTKLVTDTDEIIGEGFESDEEMTQPRFRHWKGRLQFDSNELQNGSGDSDEDGEENSSESDKKAESKPENPAPKKEEASKIAPPVKTPPQRPGKLDRPAMPQRPMGPQGQKMGPQRPMGPQGGPQRPMGPQGGPQRPMGPQGQMGPQRPMQPLTPASGQMQQVRAGSQMGTPKKEATKE